jgi:putative PEP-CTERM system histidine kinase
LFGLETREPAVWSYGLGLLGFAVFLLQLLIGWRGGLRAGLVIFAVGASALWEATELVFILTGDTAAWTATRSADALRYAAWFAFLLLPLSSPGSGTQGESALTPRLGAALAAGFFAVVLLVALLPSPPIGADAIRGSGWSFGASMVAAILGLALTEQLFRNSLERARWAVKPLCLALGATFIFDLYLYADALLFKRLDGDIWIARGVAHALVIPLLMVATARNREWTINIAVSRVVVFHSTAVLASGLYLLAVAAGGYYVRFFGGSWGKVFQIGFLFAAAVLLGVMFSSGTLRAKLRVLVNKHFFSYRYDYREEWLRFTGALSSPDAELDVNERCIKALADLVESPGGALWLEAAQGGFVQAGRWNVPAVTQSEPADGSLARILLDKVWVIDLAEAASEPNSYPGFLPPSWLAQLPRAWLVVPLFSADAMLGFVILDQSRARIEVNWEVRDLLKTAASQAASYLAHRRATEALLEASKFDSFNRMSAFVVHDLKNLTSQLSLMLRNAERHAYNPEFQKDMLETVQHAVDRMNQLLLQLRVGEQVIDKPGPVDLVPILQRIVRAKTAAGYTIRVDAGQCLMAIGHEDRLERVIGHLAQNAVDASPERSEIRIRLRSEQELGIVEIEDDGVGMTKEFIRDHLFKPFRTTKPTGMGVGTYESKQYISSLGGYIEVDSAPGQGTIMRIVLPLHLPTLPSEQARTA